TMLLATPLAALGGQQRAPALPPVSTAAMDAHLRYLSDDLLEGRAPGTRGGRLAAQYIAAQFQALGLAPAGPDGSYFQPVALVGLTPHPSLVWGTSGAPQPLKPLDDFVAWAERPEPEITADGDVVFLGYGIQAPEWHWDDYKDVSVRGKVLLLLVNDPGLQDSTVFNGRALTYYGRWTYKLEEAARHGVLGVLLIHTTASATYPWEVVRGSWSVEQFKLDRAAPRCSRRPRRSATPRRRRGAPCCSSRPRPRRAACSAARRTWKARSRRSSARQRCSTSMSRTCAAPRGTSTPSGSTAPRSGQCSQPRRGPSRSRSSTSRTCVARSTGRTTSPLHEPGCRRSRLRREEISSGGLPDGAKSRMSCTTASATTGRATNTARRSPTKGWRRRSASRCGW